MQWFVNQKVGVKLISAFLLMAAIVAFIGYRGVRNMRQQDEVLEQVFANELVSTRLSGEAATAFQHSRLVEMEMILSAGDPVKEAEFVGRLNAELATIDESLVGLTKAAHDDTEKAPIEAIRADLPTLRQANASLQQLLNDQTSTIEERRARGFALVMEPTQRATAARLRENFDKLSKAFNDSAFEFKENADKVVAAETRIFVGMIVGAVVLALGIGLLISRSVTVPLGKVVNAMERLARGELVRPDVDTTRGDELGTVANTLVATVEAQRKVIAEIKQSSSQVATSADEISASSIQIAKGAENQSSATDETSSTMVEMAAQIDQVARSAQSLAANVDETSSSIQEMGASVEQVAKNADSLLSSVEETSATIDQMTASIRSVASKVKVVDEASKSAARVAQEGGSELSNVINGIGTSSKDIGKIVRIIEEIADQTNLLALNAAIEAARAGDAGKGFAVVAEEVKRLAERSMSSTREISNFVQTVQRDVSQAVDLTRSVLKEIVDSVSNSSTLVAEVYGAAQEQSSGAAQILRTSNNMQNVTRQLATAAKEQANGAREIMKAVETMNRQTQQVADATSEQKKGGDMVVRAVEQIAQVGQQNLTATEQLSKATIGLAKEAERMQRLAEQFVL